MADMSKLVQFPSPFLKSPLSFPILSSHSTFSPLHRPLSLSSLIPHLSSPSNSPKDFLLISTSQQSDGSLVFKFGDASEIPPAVKNAEIEVESQTQIDQTAEYNDNVAVSDDKDPIVEDSKLDNTSQSDSDVRRLDSEAALEDEDIEEEESVKNELTELEVDEAVQVIELPPLQLQAEPILDEEEMIELNVEEAVQIIELPPVQLEAEPILDEEDVDEAVHVIELPPVQLEAELTLDEEVSLKNEMLELGVDEAVQVIELPPVQLEAEPILDEEVNYVGLPSIAGQDDSPSGDITDSAFQSQEESVFNYAVPSAILQSDDNPESTDISEPAGPVPELSVTASEEAHLNGLKNEMIELGVDEAVQAIELPPVQLEAEPILDGEVNYVGLPSIPGQDDSPSGDITDAAFPNLEESVVISETTVNREEVSLQSEDISALSRPMSSASYPLKFNDAVPSAILQSDDNPESTDISEPAGPVPELSVTASEEVHLNGVETTAPSLCVVSAAASVSHTAEALAGGVDAYFVCDNWFGVADGVGQWSFGGINKGLYAQELIQNCERLARESLSTGLNSLKELLQQSAARTESSGAARVLVAHIVDQVLHVANIGDSGFIVIRNGTVFKKSSPMFHEFNFPYAVSFGENPVETIEEYRVELEDGDIIVTATDGLFDNLYEREIASLVFKAVEDGKNVKDIAELLASRSQEVGRSPHARTPFADAAQAAGHPEFRGGKFDHVTVIVSIVQKITQGLSTRLTQIVCVASESIRKGGILAPHLRSLQMGILIVAPSFPNIEVPLLLEELPKKKVRQIGVPFGKVPIFCM